LSQHHRIDVASSAFGVVVRLTRQVSHIDCPSTTELRRHVTPPLKILRETPDRNL